MGKLRKSERVGSTIFSNKTTLSDGRSIYYVGLTTLKGVIHIEKVIVEGKI